MLNAEDANGSSQWKMTHKPRLSADSYNNRYCPTYAPGPEFRKLGVEILDAKEEKF